MCIRRCGYERRYCKDTEFEANITRSEIRWSRLGDGVDFAVREREFVAIIGKSGSGKSSSLWDTIGGLDTPTEGSVVVDGIRLEELNADQLALYRRRKVGFIFQQAPY